MKVTLKTPTKVPLLSLGMGDFFVEKYEDGRLSQIYQRVTMPQNLGDLEVPNDMIEEFKKCVFYSEIWCGWIYSYSKEEAESLMVYMVTPVDTSLKLKLDI